MWNKYLRPGVGGLIDGVIRTYFVATLGSKLRLNEGSVGGTLVGIAGGETQVAALVQ